MLATTGRWQIDFKKLENSVPKERDRTRCYLKSFNGRMNELMKIVNQFTQEQQLMMLAIL